MTSSRNEAPTRVFSAQEEVPTFVYTFSGATGNVRVTMELENASGPDSASPDSLNDVLFHAVGDGQLSIAFQRPWPEHPNGRVTIRCVAGSEESSATFEPELWFHLVGGIVTMESPLGDPSRSVVERKEILLARYLTRNVPKDVRLSFKAVFTKNPITPRTKAGIKPPR